jgi:hypothetical protein
MSEENTPKVTGFVSYDVHVTCPHCGKGLHLNQFPYEADDTEYGEQSDTLGMLLFGSPSVPAKWSEMNIGYVCCGCKKRFVLSQVEP